MAGKTLSEAQQKRLAEMIRSGNYPSIRALRRASGHHRGTIKRYAAALGLELPDREVHIPEPVIERARYLLEHSPVTIAQLAAAEGYSRATLRRRLHAAGLRSYGRHLRPTELSRIEAGLEAGQTPEQIAEALGRSSNTIAHYRAARLRRRARGGRPSLAEAS